MCYLQADCCSDSETLCLCLGQWNPARDARSWIRFVLVAHYRQAHTLGRRIRESERLWEHRRPTADVVDGVDTHADAHVAADLIEPEVIPIPIPEPPETGMGSLVEEPDRLARR